MISIESIKGHAEARYVLAAVVLLLAASAVLAYDYSRATGGGDGSNEGAREVVPYGDNTFIDAAGEAKLIYTVVSDTDTVKTVRITDMVRDPRSSSFTTFPTQVIDGTDTYDVVGNTVTYDGTTKKYTDDFGLEYKIDLSKTYVTIGGYSGAGSSVVFPDKIYYDDKEYKVAGVQNSCTIFQSASISSLTVLVSYDDYKLGEKFMPGNTNLSTLKFIVDNDDPAGDGLIDLQAAFKGCTGLTTLVLPNALHRADNAFEGCTGLGSDMETPFLFNTKLRITQTETSNVFANCIDTDGNGLKYLELGRNVNKVSTVFSGCTGIRVIYNTGTTISESDIAGSILESGSHNVLLFNNPGGEFTKWSSITTDAEGTAITNITMPEGTLGGVDIPEWSHKDGIARYNSGGEYTSFSPWSTNEHEYSYYYYALYGSCTVTYHVTYKDTDGTTKTDEQIQTVVCMYNTLLYDENNYPNATVQAKIKEIVDDEEKTNPVWTDATNLVPNKNTTTYRLGQSLTVFCDLDLYLYLDDISSKSITLTYKWDYIDTTGTPALKTYIYSSSATSGNINLASYADFKNAKTSSGDVLSDNAEAISYLEANYFWYSSILWSSPDGNTMNTGGGFCTFYESTYMTLKMNAGDFYYEAGGDIRWYTGPYSSVSVNPNIVISKDNTSFKCWKMNGTEYYPGEVFSPQSWEQRLNIVWNDDNLGKSTVTYCNLYDRAEGKESSEYVYGEQTTLASSYTRPGYRLVGWSYSENGNVNFSLKTPVTMLSDLRLYAVWEEGSSSQSPTVITENLLVSIDNIPAGDYNTEFIFIGALADGDRVVWTSTFCNSAGTEVAKPTDVGVYVIKVGYQVFNGTTDVTGNYYSGYDGNPVTENCYSGFLTIYGGEHSTVAD